MNCTFRVCENTDYCTQYCLGIKQAVLPGWEVRNFRKTFIGMIIIERHINRDLELLSPLMQTFYCLFKKFS